MRKPVLEEHRLGFRTYVLRHIQNESFPRFGGVRSCQRLNGMGPGGTPDQLSCWFCAERNGKRNIVGEWTSCWMLLAGMRKPPNNNLKNVNAGALATPPLAWPATNNDAML